MMHFLSRLLLALACLACAAPAVAKDETWAESTVWYQPMPVGSLTEAAGTISNLAQFFVSYDGTQIDKFVVNREGIAVATTSTSVQNNSQWVPSYGGPWIGGRYVPYYGGSTVTSQVPVTRHGQAWLGMANLSGIYLSYLPNKTNHWGVSFQYKDGTRLEVRTAQPTLARQFADAAITLAIETDPAVLAYAQVGISYKNIESKDARRLKWAPKTGMLITAVWAGSPAEAGGLRVDDVLTEINGTPIMAFAEYLRVTRTSLQDKAEAELAIKVLRAGVVHDLRVVGRNAQVAYEQAKREKQAATAANPPKLGISMRAPSAEEAAKAGLAELRGVVVDRVVANSLAEKMDVKLGDYLLELNGAAIPNTEVLAKMVGASPVQSLKVWRNGTILELRSPSARQHLGISVRDLAAGDPARHDGKGVTVTTVETNSAGAALDIRIGDLLIEANDKPVATAADLVAILGEGSVVKARVVRAGVVVELRLAISL